MFMVTIPVFHKLIHMALTAATTVGDVVVAGTTTALTASFTLGISAKRTPVAAIMAFVYVEFALDCLVFLL